MQTALEEISKRPPQRTAREREMKGKGEKRKERREPQLTSVAQELSLRKILETPVVDYKETVSRILITINGGCKGWMDR